MQKVENISNINKIKRKNPQEFVQLLRIFGLIEMNRLEPKIQEF